jgi:glycosyltransferase involved in cell wall biosynthesis
VRIGVLGGVPAALGGGGLELQVQRTSEALRARGHEVVRVEAAGREADWDVLHAFGSEGNVQWYLSHWTRHRSPLVLSPVIVASPGRQEWALRLASRLPGLATHEGQRRALLRRADLLVAITAYERHLVRLVAGRERPVAVIPNGVDPVRPGPPEPGLVGHALLVGGISARKRQAEVVEALAGSGPVVVAGAFAGTPAERSRFEAAVARARATWLGDVGDPARIARLQRDAAAVVHLSRAEVQSLAVLEALAQGTPVVLSDLPSHRELAAAHPAHVRIARGPEEVPGLVSALRDAPPPAPTPAIPTWDDVAARLEAGYRGLAA